MLKVEAIGVHEMSIEELIREGGLDADAFVEPATDIDSRHPAPEQRMHEKLEDTIATFGHQHPGRDAVDVASAEDGRARKDNVEPDPH